MGGVRDLPPRRRTKIVATIGPASIGRIRELIEAGMNVARINFSHGTETDHAHAFETIRKCADEARTPIGILVDLAGPKVRLGEVHGGELELRPGEPFVLYTTQNRGDSGGARVDYAALAKDLRTGDRVLLADGAAELRVIDVGKDVTTEIVRGGIIRSHAGVNIPAERLSTPAITDQDVGDLERALGLGADFVAQSFVRRAEDVRELRRLVGARPVKLIAKLETRSAIEEVDAILRDADAIMLARGDLGVEIPFEEVPVVQKDMLRRSGEASVVSIVATQMLESMVHAPRPTRAEASDVANAVLDGTDAILLSAETAIGSFPVEAVQAASRILGAAESMGLGYVWDRRQPPPKSDIEAIAQGAATLTKRDPNIGAIACFTRTGRTANLLSAFRPNVAVFAFSQGPQVLRWLTLLRAVIPVQCDYPTDTDEMIRAMDRRLLGDGLLPKGTRVLMVASTPVGKAQTNLLKIHQVGH